ncbi:hypothetical protein, partial [Phocaeicola sp. RTP21198st1_B8_RTP21198_201120]|uniref:DUF6712 family protein n=1 Tax=Phocaeicola sp. RTP21198st1_B8_RTP21198_201120 TaxID=3143217 RepID=UPI0034A20F60
DLQAIIGTEPIDAVDKYYREDHADGTEPDGMAETLRLMQQAVAMFTWLKVIPTLDAQHGTAGRGKHLGENETGMTALQEFKDEENIRNLAYEAVDALVELMDREKFDFWMNGIKKKAINRLLIQNKETFDEYYNIGSHRLFLVLIPMIRYNKLIEGDTVLTEKLLEYVRRPLALLTIKKAVERLPVEVLPNGIVQVQQSTTVRDKLRAEKEARQSVANSLEQDAAAYLDVLQDIIRELDAQSETVDYYIPGVTVQSKGITF